MGSNSPILTGISRGLIYHPFFSTNLTYRHEMTSQFWNSKSITEIRDRIKGGLRPSLNWPGILLSQKLWRLRCNELPALQHGCCRDTVHREHRAACLESPSVCKLNDSICGCACIMDMLVIGWMAQPLLWSQGGKANLFAQTPCRKGVKKLKM